MANFRTFTFPQKAGLSAGSTGSDVKMLQQYLQRFGYLHIPSLSESFNAVREASNAPQADFEIFDEATVLALKNFQRFQGLPISGMLDDATIAQMSKPRCGFPDIPTFEGVSNFVAQGNKWNKTNLTYGFQNFSNHLTQQECRDAISYAFNLWSQVTPLQFTEIEINSDPYDAPQNSDSVIRWILLGEIYRKGKGALINEWSTEKAFSRIESPGGT